MVFEIWFGWSLFRMKRNISQVVVHMAEREELFEIFATWFFSEPHRFLWEKHTCYRSIWTNCISLYAAHCRNCGAPSLEVLCNSCRESSRCTRCYCHLPDHLFPDDSNECHACQHRDPNNVGRYCLDCVIGDRTWRGTVHDIDVSEFAQQHQNHIIITFETARSENEAIGYYFEMEVEFYRTESEKLMFSTQQLDSIFHPWHRMWTNWIYMISYLNSCKRLMVSVVRTAVGSHLR